VQGLKSMLVGSGRRVQGRVQGAGFEVYACGFRV
jgi:hypothetical protein